MTRPIACVIGWPVSHSRSPMIHRYWLRRMGIDGDYVAVPVEPARIEAFLAGFGGSGFVGGNVTVPYKEAAFAAVDEADDVASALGAVNTLTLANGRLIGSNTDAYGFLANMDAATPGWDRAGGTAIVLGAGGAARAVVWSLLQRRLAPVIVVNRTLERAEQLAAKLGGDARPATWAALSGWLPDAQILVNATSLGMRGQPALEVDIGALPAGAIVSDLVYAPLETQLLGVARRRGLAAVSGIGMLIRQAVPGFQKWFGEEPEVTDELQALVAADLEQNE